MLDEAEGGGKLAKVGEAVRRVGIAPVAVEQERADAERLRALDVVLDRVADHRRVRRLDLAVGQSAEVTAAWVQFPSFEVKPLPQRYTRLSDYRYRYESFAPGFETEIEVEQSIRKTTSFCTERSRWLRTFGVMSTR